MRTIKWWRVAAPLCLLVVVFLLGGASNAQSGLEILITADKVAPGNDGWVQLPDGGKQWVGHRCRAKLVDAGAQLNVVSWPTIRETPNGDRRSCKELLMQESVIPVVDIVITADKVDPGNDGWVRFSDGTKLWVGSTCRGRLLEQGAALSVVSWPSIRDLPNANWLSCRAIARRVPAVTGHEIVITSDKVAAGNDGWVRFADGTKLWVSPDCRDRLVAGGARISVVPWPTIRDLPDGPWQSCEDLLRTGGGTTIPDTTVPATTTTTAASTTTTTIGTTTTTSPTTTAPPTTTTTSTPETTTPATTIPATTIPATTISVTTASTTTQPPPAGGAAENLELILSNQTRNTQFDNNEFRGVPAGEIEVSDLTVLGDIYNEGLLDTTNSGYFRVKCEVSHFAYDDPIVFPNQPGLAHLHMFFGNTEANAYSTFESLLNTGTGTCNGEDLNRTSYWVPAMLDSSGNALIPYQIMVYYKNDNFRLNGANELVSPFPDNLRMIAGDAKATSPQSEPTGGPGSRPTIGFSCGPAYNSDHLRQPLIPDCSGGGNSLEMQIAFPQCFNEAAGTYLSDQSHMSYSVNGYYGARCPDSHSTDVSSIMYRIFYSPADYGGSLTNLHLSSDVKPDRILPGGTTSHADWFGAWHPEAMAMWVENCNNTQADCETGLLDRDPAISLVIRQRGHYPRGYRAPAEELIKLCPGKDLDPSDRLRSIAGCRMAMN